MERPQRMNLRKPPLRRWASMLSLRKRTFTNILLLLHAVGDQVALALAAAREVEGAEGVGGGEGAQEVGALQAVGAVAVHEDDAGVGGGVLAEERHVQLLVVLVGDLHDLVGNVGRGEQGFCVEGGVPRLYSE